MLTLATISESALVCQLEAPAQLEKQQKLWAFAEVIREEGLGEVVLGMNNISVFFPYGTDLEQAGKALLALWNDLKPRDYEPRLVEIPVSYGGEHGQDLWEVAKIHGKTEREIVQLHSQALYTVYMIGFQAGFPYLGGLPEALHTPRRATPRTAVPAGSVGIGGSQTGIYPRTAPGGWQLIGQTQSALFDPNRNPPALLQAGDQVKFVVAEMVL
ncbi:MAG: 5-oxoprolinase subunit PxpB [Cardiobacteriaceae bacterium]|nr:5-oxoprolinase subunit PxpB [Cardiobacteriaceae bacterium]